MAYRLNEVTIRTDNSAEGMMRTEELWRDELSKRLALLNDGEFNIHQGVSPVSKYSNYESDQSGKYDLSILWVFADFFQDLKIKVGEGLYKEYDVSDDDIGVCCKKAWELVWDEQSKGLIKRKFDVDYESIVPSEFTEDGKAHCYLYISI